MLPHHRSPCVLEIILLLLRPIGILGMCSEAINQESLRERRGLPL